MLPRAGGAEGAGYHGAMGFPGGSAWAMVRDVAAGYVLVTEKSLQRFQPGELDKLAFELDRRLREIRGEAVPPAETDRVRQRQRYMQRLSGARRVLQHHRQTRRR